MKPVRRLPKMELTFLYRKARSALPSRGPLFFSFSLLQRAAGLDNLEGLGPPSPKAPREFSALALVGQMQLFLRRLSVGVVVFIKIGDQCPTLPTSGSG